MAWIIVPLLAALAATAATAAVAVRRGLSRLQSEVDEAWREFALQLEKRQQHVAAVAALCSRLLRDEPEVLARVADTGRAVLAAAARENVPALAAAEKSERAAVQALVERAGHYARLARSRAFAALVERLATLDGRVAERRERYNAAVGILNLRCNVFPSRLIAAFSGFARAEYLVVA